MTTIAWGEPELFEHPQGLLWGREFEILPSGTMYQAHGILRGMIGYPAREISGRQAEISTDDNLRACGLLGTETDDLGPYWDELAERFLGMVEAA